MARGRTWHYLLTSLKEVRMGRVGTPVTYRENTKSIKSRPQGPGCPDRAPELGFVVAVYVS